MANEPCTYGRNTGGFDMLGSGRDKIETKEQMEASKKVRAVFRIRLCCILSPLQRPAQLNILGCESQPIHPIDIDPPPTSRDGRRGDWGLLRSLDFTRNSSELIAIISNYSDRLLAEIDLESIELSLRFTAL